VFQPVVAEIEAAMLASSLHGHNLPSPSSSRLGAGAIEGALPNSAGSSGESERAGRSGSSGEREWNRVESAAKLTLSWAALGPQELQPEYKCCQKKMVV